MKTLTATELKTRTGEFFEALLSDGKVTITRNGRSFHLLLEEAPQKAPKTLGTALAMDMTGLSHQTDWEVPKVTAAPLKEINFDH